MTKPEKLRVNMGVIQAVESEYGLNHALIPSYFSVYDHPEINDQLLNFYAGAVACLVENLIHRYPESEQIGKENFLMNSILEAVQNRHNCIREINT